ncbi:hypothetical protein [Ruegeria arenilitoris]|uniref:hypothetical protein n=2 Tax=Ruegeria arenilitoris TaxID=1173585 RepID=UPI003463BD84
MHNLKMIPVKKASDPQPRHSIPMQKPKKKSYKKRKKGLFSRVLDEAWDVIEDVFD